MIEVQNLTETFNGKTVLNGITMPSSWSCEPTDSADILSYVSIACA